MSGTEVFNKRCYRCDKVVRLTAEEMQAGADNEFTICPTCAAMLKVEERFLGETVPPPGKAAA